jgi:hypothetical protein
MIPLQPSPAIESHLLGILAPHLSAEDLTFNQYRVMDTRRMDAIAGRSLDRMYLLTMQAVGHTHKSVHDAYVQLIFEPEAELTETLRCAVSLMLWRCYWEGKRSVRHLPLVSGCPTFVDPLLISCAAKDARPLEVPVYIDSMFTIYDSLTLCKQLGSVPLAPPPSIGQVSNFWAIGKEHFDFWTEVATFTRFKETVLATAGFGPYSDPGTPLFDVSSKRSRVRVERQSA